MTTERKLSRAKKIIINLLFLHWLRRTLSSVLVAVQKWEDTAIEYEHNIFGETYLSNFIAAKV